MAAYLESKPRYEILDGLRGVAALMVVVYHLFEYYTTDYIVQKINHGYLAVDFFFVLSGFVVGYAYDDRWDRMSFKDFAKRRLVRLHPMVIMGTIIGVLFFYISGNCELFNLVDSTPWWLLLVIMVVGFFLIPLPKSMDIRGWGELSSLDGPVWTLMYEYIANLLYALIIRRFSKKVLAFFVAFFACMTIILCLQIDVFGLIGNRDMPYNVIGGYVLDPLNVYIGFTRLLYPFFMGLLISRIGKYITVKHGFWWCSLIIVVLLALPHVGSYAHPWMDGVYNMACILIFFPLIVTIGAGSRLTGQRSISFCNFLGRISYPLYITHYPLTYVQKSWIQNHPDAPLGTHIMFAICLFILAMGIAYASLRLYDEPLREWLKEHWLKRKGNSSCRDIS